MAADETGGNAPNTLPLHDDDDEDDDKGPAGALMMMTMIDDVDYDDMIKNPAPCLQFRLVGGR